MADLSQNRNGTYMCTTKNRDTRKTCDLYVPEVIQGVEGCKHILCEAICCASPEMAAKRKALQIETWERFAQIKRPTQNSKKETLK